MIPVIWHRSDGYWDCALPRYVIDQATKGKCRHVISQGDLMTIAGHQAIIVIPGRHSCSDYEDLNSMASRFANVVFLIIGDEEGIFHSDRLEHPRMTIWWFMPPFHPKQKVDRVAPNGWPVGMEPLLAEIGSPARLFDWSFFGQLTHLRRLQCVDAVQGIPRGNLLATPGFTQGVDRHRYYIVMLQSKLVLCPSGPCTPDSFRFVEALECGCVPVADELTQHADYPPGYWNYIFAGQEPFPFPIIRDWSTLPEVIELYTMGWPSRAAVCQEWWLKQKMRLVRELEQDLA